MLPRPDDAGAATTACGEPACGPPDALCARLVPGTAGRVTAPAPEIFLPCKNRMFYDGPGRPVTDRARSGNYYMCGRI